MRPWTAAVPLPGGGPYWLPATVLIDGQLAVGILGGGDGRLWLRLAAGKHQVLAEGKLPARDRVQLPLPLRPRNTAKGLRRGSHLLSRPLPMQAPHISTSLRRLSFLSAARLHMLMTTWVVST